MPLFECEKCGTVDNTGLTNFWQSYGSNPPGPSLCSACDPEIGKWHGRFDQRTVAEYLALYLNGGGVAYLSGWLAREIAAGKIAEETARGKAAMEVGR